jgi:hypothetical protein
MKKLMMFSVLLVSSAVIAAEGAAPQPAKKHTPEERRAAILARTGGPIARPAKEPGICFLNLQKKVPADGMRYAISGICGVFQMSAYVREGKAGDEKNLKALVGRHVAVIAVVDEPGAPKLLVSPDESWAKINVAALETDKPNEYTLKLRLNKEMWRACAFVCGGCYTESPACLLKPARDL